MNFGVMVVFILVYILLLHARVYKFETYSCWNGVRIQ